MQETLIKPLDWLVEGTNSFRKLEKDLVPLIDLPKVPSYEITRDLNIIKQAEIDILSFIK